MFETPSYEKRSDTEARFHLGTSHIRGKGVGYNPGCEWGGWGWTTYNCAYIIMTYLPSRMKHQEVISKRESQAAHAHKHDDISWVRVCVCDQPQHKH